MSTSNEAEADSESAPERADTPGLRSSPVHRWRAGKLGLLSSGVWFVGLRKRLRRGRRPVSASVATWPLIWILVFLVFPMLATWVPLPVRPPMYVNLPSATHGEELVIAPVLRVRPDGSVTLDGRLVSLEPSTEEGPGVAHLDAVLGTLRRNWSVLHPDRSFVGEILVIAPRSTEWGALRPALRICAAAGYPHIGFVIRLDPPMVGGAFGSLGGPETSL